MAGEAGMRGIQRDPLGRDRSELGRRERDRRNLEAAIHLKGALQGFLDLRARAQPRIEADQVMTQGPI